MSEGEPSAPRPPGTAISWPRRRRRRRDGLGPGAAERLRAGRGRPPGTGTGARTRTAPLLAAGKKLEIPRSLPGQPGGAEEPGDDGGAGAMELKRGMALPRLLLLGLWAAALRDGAAAAGEALAALRGRGGSGRATGGRGARRPPAAEAGQSREPHLREPRVRGSGEARCPARTRRQRSGQPGGKPGTVRSPAAFPSRRFPSLSPPGGCGGRAACSGRPGRRRKEPEEQQGFPQLPPSPLQK